MSIAALRTSLIQARVRIAEAKSLIDAAVCALDDIEMGLIDAQAAPRHRARIFDRTVGAPNPVIEPHAIAQLEARFRQPEAPKPQPQPAVCQPAPDHRPPARRRRIDDVDYEIVPTGRSRNSPVAATPAPNAKRYVSIAERVAKVRRDEADAKAAEPLRLGTFGGDLAMRPDRPAHERGAQVLPAEFYGDPGPGRSALDARNAEGRT